MTDYKAFDDRYVNVSELHSIRCRQFGNPQGTPAIYLHGGPGLGSFERDLQHFDLEKYRVVLFDQRGCGESLPLGELRENTTEHLIQDIQQITKELSLGKSVIVGESWGSALALLYAERFPHNVNGLVISGTFLARQEDIDWLYKPEGAAAICPERWEVFTENLTDSEKQDVITGYERMLNDPELCVNAAASWNAWPPVDMDKSPTSLVVKGEQQIWYQAFTEVGFHYWKNSLFLEDDVILRNLNRISHIPMEIVHGENDIICPVYGAVDLAEAHAKSNLEIVQAGHSVGSLVSATDRLYNQITGERPVPLFDRKPQI